MVVTRVFATRAAGWKAWTDAKRGAVLGFRGIHEPGRGGVRPGGAIARHARNDGVVYPMTGVYADVEPERLSHHAALDRTAIRARSANPSPSPRRRQTSSLAGTRRHNDAGAAPILEGMEGADTSLGTLEAHVGGALATM